MCEISELVSLEEEKKVDEGFQKVPGRFQTIVECHEEVFPSRTNVKINIWGKNLKEVFGEL